MNNLVWQDLPKRINAFTVRNATMRDLKTNKIMQYYSANTRITVVQKLVTENGTYYRTESAAKHGLNWAFEASAFGLPNEVAPSAPNFYRPPNNSQSKQKVPRGSSVTKQKAFKTPALPKDGECKAPKKTLKDKIKSFFKR